MKRVICAVGMATALLLRAAPAMAQMRPPLILPPPGGAKIHMPPQGPRGPSGAVLNAIRNNPGSRALGVVPNGNNFVVRIKKGNQIILVPGY